MADPKSLPAPDAPVMEHDDLAWELFWHKHKTSIFGGAAAAVLALVAGVSWVVANTQANEAAQRMLADAKDSAAWEAVIAKYPKSMPAADAYFQLAGAQRADGKTEDSTATFRKFLATFPEHPLAGGALFGVGQNLDSEGKSSEAIAIYQEVVTKYPGSYAAPFAAYSESEVLLRESKRQEARAALELIVAQFPDSNVARLAQSQLQRLAGAPGVR